MSGEITVNESLERGVTGTKKTLAKMNKLVALGKLDPTMQRIATWIRLQVPKDRRGSTTAVLDQIFHWVKRHGVFQRDPFQIEKIEHPIAAMKPVIEMRKAGKYRGPGLFVGDCDTIAGVYTATLGGILGFQYAWETAKVDPHRPDEFSHVWVSFRTNGDWYALDPSTASAFPGWRPPITQEQFGRWPEGPIEDMIEGKGMSGLNGGMGMLGNGEEVGEKIEEVVDFAAHAKDGMYPAEEYGYGIPKQFGPDGAEGMIPQSDMANLQLLTEHDSAIPRADLEPGLTYIKAGPGKNPARRVFHIKGQPDDHGPPYYRGRGRQPYIKVEKYPYPPGSPWNGRLGHDIRRFWRSGPTIQNQNPGTPERQVHVVTEQPMAIRKRRVTILTSAERLPSGMGQVPGLVTSLDQDPEAPAKATEASKSVWDTITDTITKALPAIGTVAATAFTNKYAGALAKATNTVAGQQVATVATYTAPKPWYASPWVWIGGLTAVAAGAYVVMKSRGRSRR